MKDYYKILGVDEDADQKEIKKAFRKLAKKHHPDSKSGNEEKFKKINEAYDVLGNEESRQKYDRKRNFKTGRSFGGGGFNDNFEGGFSIEDIFNEFEKNRRRRYRQHAEKRLELHIPFQTSLTETTKSIRIDGDIITVKIPGGVPSGWSTTVDSQKNIKLIVNVETPTNYYDRRGLDLYKDIKIDALRVISGVTIRLKNIYGEKIEVKIPPQTKPGELFLISGEGIEFENRRGDLYLKINYTMPNLNEKEIKELKKFVKNHYNNEQKNKKDFEVKDSEKV